MRISGPIETARLTLGPFALEDAGAIHNIYADPAVWEHTHRIAASKSLTETRRQVARFIACQTQHGYGSWTVHHKQNGELTMHLGLIPRDWNGPEIKLGYQLAPNRWGKGFASEAAAAWPAVAFQQLKLERIVAVARAEPLAPAE